MVIGQSHNISDQKDVISAWLQILIQISLQKYKMYKTFSPKYGENCVWQQETKSLPTAICKLFRKLHRWLLETCYQERWMKVTTFSRYWKSASVGEALWNNGFLLPGRNSTGRSWCRNDMGFDYMITPRPFHSLNTALMDPRYSWRKERVPLLTLLKIIV